MNVLRTSLVVAAVFALTAPGVAGAKRKPPPPPPDSAADCTFVAVASVPDYLVLASIDIGVNCATVKQSISVSTHVTRDGVLTPVLPEGSENRTCSNAAACFVSYDLFSLDTQPVPIAGDQVYCGTGTAVVAGTVLGPGTACEEDPRL